MLKHLKKKLGDREKVLSWLDSIGEHDEACRAQVIEQCSKDISARQYFVSRYESEVAK